MATVLLSDHNREIKKHEKLLDVAIDKLRELKKIIPHITNRT